MIFFRWETLRRQAEAYGLEAALLHDRALLREARNAQVLSADRFAEAAWQAPDNQRAELWRCEAQAHYRLAMLADALAARADERARQQEEQDKQQH